MTATALLAGILLAGIVLDRWLAGELEARAREELTLAPRFLADRNEAISEGLVMHARDVARAPGLVEALRARNQAAALRQLDSARGSYGDRSLLVAGNGEVWAGPAPPRELVEATVRGETPVSILFENDSLHMVALAPIRDVGAWLGAAGVGISLGKALAGTLAGLTRAEVVIVAARGRVAATTDTTLAATVLKSAPAWPRDEEVHEARMEGRRYLVARATLGDVATVFFARDLRRELAVLPKLRRVIALSGMVELGLGMLLGTLFAIALARPVRSLAEAARRIAEGDFEAPLERSSIREVDGLAQAFESMRGSLAARLRELEGANRELAARQERLRALKSELLQRERQIVSGRLVTELAHEIRNPVANLRNSLELLRRRMVHDREGREYAELAIDELLRMHALSEQLLDLHRPRPPDIRSCEIASVASEVARLASVGVPPDDFAITITGRAKAAIPPDALKQVLLNLFENAREVRPHGLRIDVEVWREDSHVCVEVSDNGPGIPPEILPEVFDPFFTTKASVEGLGLGLFIAEGLVHKYGGRISATNQEEGSGAVFRIELLSAEEVGVRSTA